MLYQSLCGGVGVGVSVGVGVGGDVPTLLTFAKDLLKSFFHADRPFWFKVKVGWGKLR